MSDDMIDLMTLGAEHRADMEWKRYHAEGDKFLVEMLADDYAEHMDGRLPDEILRAHADIAKRFHVFCTEVGVSDTPAGPGAVAAFLHLQRKQGVTNLEPIVEALSYLAQFRESYDATRDPLVRAIVKAAAQDNTSPNKKEH
jgi:hypothetical protein